MPEWQLRYWIALHARWIIAFAVSNLPFWVLGVFYFVDRPWISLDALLAALLMAVSPLAGGVLLLLAWSADGIYSASKLYFFHSPDAMLSAARFMGAIDTAALVRPSWLAFGSLFIGCAFGVARLATLGRASLRVGSLW